MRRTLGLYHGTPNATHRLLELTAIEHSSRQLETQCVLLVKYSTVYQQDAREQRESPPFSLSEGSTNLIGYSSFHKVSTEVLCILYWRTEEECEWQALLRVLYTYCAMPICTYKLNIMYFIRFETLPFIPYYYPVNFCKRVYGMDTRFFSRRSCLEFDSRKDSVVCGTKIRLYPCRSLWRILVER